MSTPQETLDTLGLTVRAEFVPFSQSRNRDEKNDRGNPRYSLNWRVTLVRQPAGGAQMHGAPLNASAPPRDILTTDYSAGIAHCPAYKRVKNPARMTVNEYDAIRIECEEGRAVTHGVTVAFRGKPIRPNSLDVIASLVMDASALDESSFEDWASSLGYDTDSRKAETIYRVCLDIAVKLRNSVGESGLAALRDAFAEY